MINNTFAVCNIDTICSMLANGVYLLNSKVLLKQNKIKHRT